MTYRKELKNLLSTEALGPPCFNGERKYLERISQYLCEQLFLGYNQRRLHLHRVICELDYLEGLILRTSTVKPKMFKNPSSPLLGFWKKHFFQPENILGNMSAHWGLDYYKGDHCKENRKLNDLVERELESSYGEDLSQEKIGKLAYKMVLGGFNSRQEKKKLTGDWIVYKPDNGMNYYLGLFPHKKQDENHYDQQVYEFVEKICKNEYPFLFSGRHPS